MAGESVLLIEDSSGERDFAQTILEDAGYKVVTAANAAAALTYPDMQNVALIVMDAMLDGVSGFDATRMLRQNDQTNPIPVLALIPDDKIEERQDVSARGANGYLLKPYDGRTLVKKVRSTIEDVQLDLLTRRHLVDAADRLMAELSDKHIKDAVERKTKIIIERCIQNVSSAVDERAKQEVQERVTALTAEKEQELVKVTVREVAQSMVEKLAERKVSEAMETLLPETAERNVKRIADQLIPTLIRERAKDTLNNMLPREVQTRLQKAAEKMVPEISEQLVATIEAIANKTVPKISRDILPEIGERQMRQMATEQLPRMVSDLVGREVQKQMADQMEPVIHKHARALRRIVLVWNSIMTLAVGGLLAVVIYYMFFAK